MLTVNHRLYGSRRLFFEIKFQLPDCRKQNHLPLSLFVPILKYSSLIFNMFFVVFVFLMLLHKNALLFLCTLFLKFYFNIDVDLNII